MKIINQKRSAQIVMLACMMLVLSFSLEGTCDKNEKSYLTNSIEIHQETPKVQIHGVKVFVKDLEEAEDFYTSFLGLEIENRKANVVELNTGQYPIYLIQSGRHVERDLLVESHYGISFLTSKLLPSIDKARESKVKIYDTLLSRNGIGIHIPITDPSGNLLHLMEVQIGKQPNFNGFRLYNSGMTINNMKEAEGFYKQQFGLLDWSRDYLPDALPLKHSDGSFAFMLHQDNNLLPSTLEFGTSPGVVLMLQTVDISAYAKFLNSIDRKYLMKEGRILVRDTNENTIEVVEMR
ncbi:VOC family protein [Ekhidna sp.]|uniref:VOC family protein n=1 Tax=Ekhidna sp. TaxID=2608089 RepID=UPI00329912B6